MTKLFGIAAATLLLSFAGVSMAQDAMAPGSAPAPAGAQIMAPMTMEGQMGQMDEHMNKMQALHARMTNAATPAEREKVMDEQRQEMQGCMSTMNQMTQGAGMMGHAGSAMMDHKGAPGDAIAPMRMMQKRMDMMEMMMQTMMDRQVATGTGMAQAPRK